MAIKRDQEPQTKPRTKSTNRAGIRMPTRVPPHEIDL